MLNVQTKDEPQMSKQQDTFSTYIIINKTKLNTNNNFIHRLLLSNPNQVCIVATKMYRTIIVINKT